MTERERICLTYLDHLMEATATMIGREIISKVTGGGSNYIAVGANVAGRLRKRGLVIQLPELNAWRITRQGREELRAARAGDGGLS